MKRAKFIQEKRRLNEERYDTEFSLDYDVKYGQISKTHHQNLMYFLSQLPKKSVVLDAACGTGKYWDLVIKDEHHVIGLDQSTGMLKAANAKHPSVFTIKMGLQEMDYTHEFWGIMCIDALENVAPEDWEIIIKNFNKALIQGGYLYLTIELTNAIDLDEAYQSGVDAGLPLVKGEVAQGDGYHYYPSIDQVRQILSQEHFFTVKEEEGDDYYHIICKKME